MSKGKLIAALLAVFAILTTSAALVAERPMPGNNSQRVWATPMLSWTLPGDNLLANGGFEQGLTGWTGSAAALSNFSPPEGTNVYKLGSVSAQLTLPASSTPILWSFQLYGLFSDGVSAAVRALSRQTLKSQSFRSSGYVSQGWSTYVVDLSEFAGQTVVLALTYSGDTGTYCYVDDVRVTALPPDVEFDVRLSLRDSELVARTTSPFFQAPRLDPLHNYTWRVDTIAAGATNTGPTWHFKTGSSLDIGSIAFADFPWPLLCPDVPAPIEYFFLDDYGFRATNGQNRINLTAVADDAQSPSIIISEVSPGGFSAGMLIPQAVEFVNASASPVNVKGWKIELFDGANYIQFSQVIVLPDRDLAAAEIFTISDRSSANVWPELRMKTCSWAGGNFAVLLRDASNNIVDCILQKYYGAEKVMPHDWLSYSTNTPVAPKSLQRVGNRDMNVIDDWIVATNTLGTLNQGLQLPFARGFGKLPARFFKLLTQSYAQISTPATNARIWARSTSPVVTGYSQPFTVVEADFCLSMAAPETINENDGNVPIRITVGAPVAADLSLMVQSSNPEVLEVPSLATIPAGASEVTI